jgi:hypothetical protein
VNTSSSPSPQMNWLLAWLFRRHPRAQFLALHIAGKRNWGADGLSRDGADGATIADVLASVEGGGRLRARRLQLPKDRAATFAEAASLPQSARSQARKERRRGAKRSRCMRWGGSERSLLLPPSSPSPRSALHRSHRHRLHIGQMAVWGGQR